MQLSACKAFLKPSGTALSSSCGASREKSQGHQPHPAALPRTRSSEKSRAAGQALATASIPAGSPGGPPPGSLHQVALAFGVFLALLDKDGLSSLLAFGFWGFR